jgi:hypothetical protein
MKLWTSRVFWGIMLIAGGILFLIQNLFEIQISGYFWAGIFALAGFTFFAYYASEREAWWALIPGFTLIGLAGMILFGAISNEFAERFGAALFLSFIGLGFVAVFLVNRANWWALIPAGVLVTIGAVTLGDLGGVDTGGVFFLGLALTFLLVAVAPTPAGPMRWAYIPAGILGVMGLLLLAAAGRFIDLVIPVALIVIGLFLLLKTIIPIRSSR